MADLAALGGLAGSLIVGVASNLLSDPLRDALAHVSAGWRKRRINAILADRQHRDWLRAQPAAAVAKVGRLLLPTFASLASTALFGAVGLVLTPQRSTTTTRDIYYASAGLGVIAIALAGFLTFRSAGFCRKLYDPDWYGQKTARELAKLGWSLEVTEEPLYAGDPGPSADATEAPAADANVTEASGTPAPVDTDGPPAGVGAADGQGEREQPPDL